jgi:hypothetical protein
MFNESKPPLVPDRECGDCNVCCVHPMIDDEGLQKPQGVRCHNALPDNRCAIYESRPSTCRGFFCGWRMLKWVKPGLRPDISGVLVTLSYHDATGALLPPNEIDGKAVTGVMFTLLRREGLNAEGLAESVAAAVGSGAPVLISVPGPPAHPSGIVRTDESLRPAVLNRDREGVLRLLRAAWRQAHDGAFAGINRSDPPVAPGGPV